MLGPTMLYGAQTWGGPTVLYGAEIWGGPPVLYGAETWGGPTVLYGAETWGKKRLDQPYCMWQRHGVKSVWTNRVVLSRHGGLEGLRDKTRTNLEMFNSSDK